MMTLFKDIKYAFRRLRKNPGFSAVVVLSLALGIGMNASALCWIQNLVVHSLPGVSKADELVVLLSNQGGGNISWLDSRDFDQLDNVFAGVLASQVTPAHLRVGQQSEWIHGQIASANFFDLLGVKPILGRTFLPEEDHSPGGHPVLVIGEKLWKHRFAGDPSIIGKTVDLNRHPFEIIGVVPADFRGTMIGIRSDFWAPLTMQKEVANYAEELTNRSARPFHNLARLKSGVHLEQAQAAIDIMDAQFSETYPRSNYGIHHRVVTLSECPYGAKNLIPMLTLILIVSLGVLLIVATNVANLLLVRTVSRQKEISIRLASGAGRFRILRQLLTESLLLAMLGGLLGVVFAQWAGEVIPQFFAKSIAVNLVSFRMDNLTIFCTFLLTFITGLGFGLVPAIQVFRLRLSDALRQGGRSGGAGTSHQRLRDVLVISEISVALVLLIAAGLCLRGFANARRVNIGFDPEQVLVAEMRIGMNGYDEEKGLAFYRRLEQHLRDLPGVQQAALSSWFPLGLSGCKGLDFHVDGYVPQPGEDETYNYSIVSPHYFDTMDIPLLDGRCFSDQDTANAPFAAIVNEQLVRKFWPDRNPIGQRFRSHGKWRTVVGIVPTGKYQTLNESPRCFFYLPYQQGVWDLDLNICIRTSGPPERFASSLRQAVRDIDPAVDVLRVQPLTSHIQGALFAQNMVSCLLGLLGMVALTLSAMGVYAVMAYSVSQRTQEFGIRIALGARTSDVLGQVFRKGLILATIGLGFGLTLAFIVTRLLTSFLYGVNPFDPLTFASVSLLLAVVVLLACWRPALRAARCDPMEALRYE